MAQNKNVILRVMGPDYPGTKGTFGVTEVGSITLQPLRNRNGIFEYAGKEVSGPSGLFSTKLPSNISASVRQGSGGDPIRGIARVKRKAILRTNLAIDLTNENGNYVDFITVDVTINSPIQASVEQLTTALAFALSATYDKGADGIAGNPATPLKDLVLNGIEPF